MPNAFAMTPPSLQPDAPAEPSWFIQAAGQVWGPYKGTRIVRFVAEGRVTPQTLVAAGADGPFHPAGRWRSLAPLFQGPKLYHHQPAPGSKSEPAPRFAPTPKPEPIQPAPSAAPVAPLLVWAELVSLDAGRFGALIARHGGAIAIRPTVWLVQARCSPAALRNALSRHLTGADALMIVHAPLDRAAWFNLDSAAERRLRQLWGEAG